MIKHFYKTKQMFHQNNLNRFYQKKKKIKIIKISSQHTHNVNYILFTI